MTPRSSAEISFTGASDLRDWAAKKEERKKDLNYSIKTECLAASIAGRQP